MNRHGSIFKRTIFDKNEVFDRGDYLEMALYSGIPEQKIIAYTKIDKEDWIKINKLKWGLDGNGYVRNVKNNISLATYLMNCPKGMTVDHKNHDILDNRKFKLRIATYSENNCNIKKRVSNTSGYKGVDWKQSHNAWRYRIHKNGKQIVSGYFPKARWAAMAYDLNAKEIHGKFALLNFNN
jgi:hypothetical protein